MCNKLGIRKQAMLYNFDKYIHHREYTKQKRKEIHMYHHTRKYTQRVYSYYHKLNKKSGHGHKNTKLLKKLLMYSFIAPRMMYPYVFLEY